jgi:NAD(P)-dependent dehydrogenase (short-subunit alcohol dehydrogenase family)
MTLGANRGIGLRFVQKFSEEGWDVFASVRPQAVEDDSITEVRECLLFKRFELTGRCDQLKMTGAKIFLIDYLDEDTIAGAAKEYGSKPLDCLINCAGELYY